MQAHMEDLTPQIYQRLFPQKYITKHLNEEKRFDSRSLLQYRKVNFTTHPFPHCNASSRVSIGNTTVAAVATYQLGLPSIFDDNAESTPVITPNNNNTTTAITKRQGQIHFNILAPTTSGTAVAGTHPRNIKLQLDAIKQQINDIAIQQSWYDLSLLYINEKLVWHIYIDVMVENHDGNLFDAIFLAYQHVLLLTMRKYLDAIPLIQQQLQQHDEERRAEQAMSDADDDGAEFGSSKKAEDYRTLLAQQIRAEANKSKALLVDFKTLTPEKIKAQIEVVEADKNQDMSSPSLLHIPPIILNKLLFPTQLAIITTKTISYPPGSKTAEDTIVDAEEDVEGSDNKKQQLPPKVIDKNVYIMDPTLDEETFVTSHIYTVLDNKGQICFMNKSASLSPASSRAEPILAAAVQTFNTIKVIQILQQSAQHCARLSKLITLPKLH